MNREGTLHIVLTNPREPIPRYQVGFADYATSGGAMKTRQLDGEQALRNFFTSIGINERNAMSVFQDLRTEGEASIMRVILPEHTLAELGLEEPPRTGKDKIEKAIRMLRQQGHAVEAVVRQDGTMWFQIDNHVLTAWQDMLNLADGFYTFEQLLEMYRSRAPGGQESLAVRFTVFKEGAGPVLAYAIAGPFIPATFASRAGARYDDTKSLIDALNRVGLPGKEISGFTDKVYIVTRAQLSQLGLKPPPTTS